MCQNCTDVHGLDCEAGRRREIARLDMMIAAFEQAIANLARRQAELESELADHRQERQRLDRLTA